MEMSGENKWTKSTKNQVKRLASLVGQLITLSKMDEGDGAAETKGRKLVCDIEDWTCSLNGFIAVMPREIQQPAAVVLACLWRRQWRRHITAS